MFPRRIGVFWPVIGRTSGVIGAFTEGDFGASPNHTVYRRFP